MMSWSYSLVENGVGRIIAHDPACPAVRALADAGEPVATLLDCAKPLPPDVLRHSCLDGEANNAAVQ